MTFERQRKMRMLERKCPRQADGLLNYHDVLVALSRDYIDRSHSSKSHLRRSTDPIALQQLGLPLKEETLNEDAEEERDSHVHKHHARRGSASHARHRSRGSLIM